MAGVPEPGHPEPSGPAAQGSSNVSSRGTRFSWKRVFLALLLVFALVSFFGLLDVLGTPSRKDMLGAECAARLRRLGIAALTYADKGERAFPPNLESLVDGPFISAPDLVSRFNGHQPPACDFSYVAGLTLADPLRWILVYADPAHCNGRNGCVFYLDGNTAYLREPQFSQELARFKAAYEQARGQPPVIIPPH